MKAFWWQGGVHLEPDNEEEREVLRGFVKMLDLVEVHRKLPPLERSVVEARHENFVVETQGGGDAENQLIG